MALSRGRRRKALGAGSVSGHLAVLVVCASPSVCAFASESRLVLPIPIRTETGPAAAGLEAVLHRAGAAVAALEEKLAITIAREEYGQLWLVGRDTSPRVRRTLVSDVAWVPTGDAIVWAFYRDVLTVDGEPVRDRSTRLDELFAGGLGPEVRARAARILDESARYNLGTRRTLNFPTVALSALHPRNRPRFRFRAEGTEALDGVPTLKIRFAEAARPTLIVTSGGKDVPARGFLWVEPTGGALVASELKLEASGMPAEIKVVYRFHERLTAWLPAEMHEAYGNRTRGPGDERVEATASYSDYRRGLVELGPILPVR
jgi:hypothetical protein